MAWTGHQITSACFVCSQLIKFSHKISAVNKWCIKLEKSKDPRSQRQKTCLHVMHMQRCITRTISWKNFRVVLLFQAVHGMQFLSQFLIFNDSNKLSVIGQVFALFQKLTLNWLVVPYSFVALHARQSIKSNFQNCHPLNASLYSCTARSSSGHLQPMSMSC